MTHKACRCGSGNPRRELFDARGIFVNYCCDDCEERTRIKYRPEIFTNPNYSADEEIESDG